MWPDFSRGASGQMSDAGDMIGGHEALSVDHATCYPIAPKGEVAEWSKAHPGALRAPGLLIERRALSFDHARCYPIAPKGEVAEWSKAHPGALRAPGLSIERRALSFDHARCYPIAPKGEVAEWSKAHAWNACRRETVSRVRIPLSPPFAADCAAFYYGSSLAALRTKPAFSKANEGQLLRKPMLFGSDIRKMSKADCQPVPRVHLCDDKCQIDNLDFRKMLEQRCV